MSKSRSYQNSILQTIRASCESSGLFNEILANGVSADSFEDMDPSRYVFSAISAIRGASKSQKLDKGTLIAKSLDIVEKESRDPGIVLVFEHKINEIVEESFKLDCDKIDTEYAASVIVAECVQRRISEQLLCFSENIKDGKKNASQTLKELGELQISVSRSLGKKSKVSTILEMKDKIISDLTTEEDPPVPTGFRGLDDALLGGFQNSYLVYVAGRPGMAKTQVLINMAIRAAQAGKKVLFMTYELPAPFIVKRILAYLSDLTLGQLIGGVKSKDKISQEDIEKLRRLIDSLEQNIFVCDACGMNIAESAAFVRSEIESKDIGSAYFDYVQIIRTPDGRVPEKESDFASISFILRELAAGSNIPVIAAAQLNREVEKRKNKRPALSDLRSSGSLENDARVVIGLYRDEYYNKFSEDKDILEMSILKNTNGELITTRNFFNKPKCTILELEENLEEPQFANPDKTRFEYPDDEPADLQETDFGAWSG